MSSQKSTRVSSFSKYARRTCAPKYITLVVSIFDYYERVSAPGSLLCFLEIHPNHDACFIVVNEITHQSTFLFLRAVSESVLASIRNENINDCFFKTRLCTDGKRRKTKAEFWSCAAEPTLFLPVWGPNTHTRSLHRGPHPDGLPGAVLERRRGWQQWVQ